MYNIYIIYAINGVYINVKVMKNINRFTFIYMLKNAVKI